MCPFGVFKRRGSRGGCPNVEINVQCRVFLRGGLMSVPVSKRGSNVRPCFQSVQSKVQMDFCAIQSAAGWTQNRSWRIS